MGYGKNLKNLLEVKGITVKEIVRGKIILPSHGKEFLHPTVRTFYMPR